MKFLKRTEIVGAKEDEAQFSEEEITEKDIKVGETIHICRHDEGLPCTIKKW